MVTGTPKDKLSINGFMITTGPNLVTGKWLWTKIEPKKWEILQGKTNYLCIKLITLPKYVLHPTYLKEDLLVNDKLVATFIRETL